MGSSGINAGTWGDTPYSSPKQQASGARR